jgi:Secretion system C-terminal sorting domain
MIKAVVYNTILVSMLSVMTILNAQIQIPSYTNTKLVKLSVTNNKIYISGPNYLRQSTDGCNTLTPVNLPLSGNSFIEDFHLLDVNNLYLMMLNYDTIFNNYKVKLYHSSNAGQSWVNIFNTTTLFSNYRIHFFDNLEGVIIEQSSRLLIRTKDGGITWNTEQNFPNSLPNNLKISGDRDSTIYISADECGIASTNRGKNFRYAPNGASETNDAFVLNRDTIFTTTRNKSLYYTLDGINSVAGPGGPFIGWKPEYCSFNPTAFCYKKPNKLFFAGQDLNNQLVIVESFNFINNWIIYNTPFTAKINNIKFINDSIAILCGDSGKLFRWIKNQPLLVNVNDIGVYSTISGINLSPNPSANQQILSIVIKEIKSLQIYLIDYTGKRLSQMFNGITKSGNNKINLNIENVPKGIYFYEVKLDNTIERIRFVKD